MKNTFSQGCFPVNFGMFFVTAFSEYLRVSVFDLSYNEWLLVTNSNTTYFIANNVWSISFAKGRCFVPERSVGLRVHAQKLFSSLLMCVCWKQEIRNETGLYFKIQFKAWKTSNSFNDYKWWKMVLSGVNTRGNIKE